MSLFRFSQATGFEEHIDFEGTAFEELQKYTLAQMPPKYMQYKGVTPLSDGAGYNDDE